MPNFYGVVRLWVSCEVENVSDTSSSANDFSMDSLPHQMETTAAPAGTGVGRRSQPSLPAVISAAEQDDRSMFTMGQRVSAAVWLQNVAQFCTKGM